VTNWLSRLYLYLYLTDILIARIVYVCMYVCMYVQVSDLGGGVPRSGMSKIWSYQYTTADVKKRDEIVPHTGEFKDELELAYQSFHRNFYG
jgi:hypothetical protein